MSVKRVKVTVTTDGSGVATAYSPRVSGRVLGIAYVKDTASAGANAYANGVDFTITAELTGENIWTQTDVNASVVVHPNAPQHDLAGVAALYGPLHGGANEAVLHIFDEIGDADNVVPWLDRALSEKRKIMGFGHRVYKHGDSRVPTMKAALDTLIAHYDRPDVEALYTTLEREFVARKGIYPNLDYPSGPAYNLMGFDTLTFTPLFVAARVVGWTAHIMEQAASNALIRPLSAYVGPDERHIEGFVDEVGISPRRWLTEQRVLSAKNLLETTSASVDEVASMIVYACSRQASATTGAAVEGRVSAAMWGVTMTRGWDQKACAGGSGSVWNTSSTASPTCPRSSAASRSASTISVPRPGLMRVAPRGSSASRAASSSPRVASVSGRSEIRISARASAAPRSDPASAVTSSTARPDADQPATSKPSAASACATAPPSAPVPSTVTRRSAVSGGTTSLRQTPSCA